MGNNIVITNEGALKLEGKQIQLGRIRLTGRYQTYEWDPLPESTPTVIAIGRSPGSLFLDELDQQIQLAKYRGVNDDRIKQIVRDLNALQEKVGYSSDPVLAVKKWEWPCACLGVCLFIPCCIYIEMAKKAGQKYLSLRRKLRKEALKYAEAHNDELHSSYGFIVLIPERFPEYIQIQFVQQDAMLQRNHNTEIRINISFRTEIQNLLKIITLMLDLRFLF